MSAPPQFTTAPSLTDSPYLQRNLTAHYARWQVSLPGAAGAHVDVAAVPRVGDVGGTPCWPSQSMLRVRLRDPSGTYVRVHSDRDPWTEAQLWLGDNCLNADTPRTLVMVGAGLGYALDAVEPDPMVSVLVLEPEPDLVPWLLARRDWTPLIEAGRLLIVPGPSYDEAARAWGIFRRTHREAPRLLAHPVTARVRPDATAAAGLAVSTALHGARANALARRRFEAPYLLNTIANTGRLHDAPGIASLAGVASGRPVVIAGAGPSLNSNLEDLRPHRRQVVLLATDTALRPLIAAGLAPDYVVAVDPGAMNSRHLANVTEVPLTTTLVAEASVDPASFSSFGTRIVFFRVADHAPWRWLTRVGIDPGRLRAWGSVLTSAFDLALHMGAAPVIFIGADLAFTSDQPYCRGTVYEADWHATSVADGIPLHEVWARTIATQAVTTAGLEGRPVRTAPHLVAYRDWLTRAANDVDATRPPGTQPRIVNATGAGILVGDAIAQRSIADALYFAASPFAAGHAPVGTISRTHRPMLDPLDAHLLSHAMDHPVTNRSTESLPASIATPYMSQPRRERVRDTQRLRMSRGTDTVRWRETENLDPAWERRAIAAAALIPPGASVLDLGAGREALSRHLPACASYVPADLVARSPRTVVVNVNAGEFPSGDFDVVTTLGLLEYVHDLRTLLSTATKRAGMLVASYCVMTRGTRDTRLQRGWMNDLVLADLMDLFVETGWDVASATRLDGFEEFDQWLFACRRRERGQSEQVHPQQASSNASDAVALAD